MLGDTLGDILLWDVVLSISVCCLAIHTAAIRMMFSMARDNALPGSKLHREGLREVAHADRAGRHRRRLAVIILLVNINQPKIFTVITGIAIVMIYLAYLCVTVPLLRRRTRGLGGPGQAEGLFSMGGAGTTVNALAVAYGAFMAINIGWPRNEIYGAGNYMWGGLIFIVGVIAIGGIYFAAVGSTGWACSTRTRRRATSSSRSSRGSRRSAGREEAGARPAGRALRSRSSGGGDRVSASTLPAIPIRITPTATLTSPGPCQ